MVFLDCLCFLVCLFWGSESASRTLNLFCLGVRLVWCGGVLSALVYAGLA